MAGYDGGSCDSVRDREGPRGSARVRARASLCTATTGTRGWAGLRAPVAQCRAEGRRIPECAASSPVQSSHLSFVPCSACRQRAQVQRGPCAPKLPELWPLPRGTGAGPRQGGSPGFPGRSPAGAGPSAPRVLRAAGPRATGAGAAALRAAQLPPGAGAPRAAGERYGRSPRGGRLAAASTPRPRRSLCARRAPAALPGRLGHHHQRQVTRQGRSRSAGRPAGRSHRPGLLWFLFHPQGPADGGANCICTI